MDRGLHYIATAIEPPTQQIATSHHKGKHSSEGPHVGHTEAKDFVSLDSRTFGTNNPSEGSEGSTDDNKGTP